MAVAVRLGSRDGVADGDWVGFVVTVGVDVGDIAVTAAFKVVVEVAIATTG